MNDAWSEEIRQGGRFRFGANWKGFLERLDESRIAQAEDSLAGLLGSRELSGLRMLDIGCGSGLFSLAARRLGAIVASLDYDPDSVACAEALRQTFRPHDPDWRVVRGSVLDEGFMRSLGRFDIVYSWGVLHHTGDQWAAMANAAQAVAPGGLLAIALYNHQPFFTPLHRLLKRTYNASPAPGKLAIAAAYALGVGSALFAADLLRGRNPLARHARAGLPRGMSFWHDVVDWAGGWPFETSTPEEVFRFHRDRGFQLVELRTVGGKSGCNEFVFRLPAATGERPCACS